MSAITCSKCGSPNRAGAKFCANCRAPLASPPPAPTPPPVTPRQPSAPTPPLVMPRQPPAPTPALVTPRQPPAPLPVTPRQPPAPPVTPRQPPQSARPPARRSLFTRGRIIGGVIALVLLCVCMSLVFALRAPLMQLAGLGATPTSRPSVPLPPPPVSSPAPMPATPSVVPATVVPPPATVTQSPAVSPSVAPPPGASPSTAPAQPSVTAIQPTLPQPIATLADTLPGLTLRPGDSWRIGTQVITLQPAKFSVTGCAALFEFDVIFENTATTEVVVTLRGQDLSVTNDQAQTYDTFFWLNTKPADCTQFQPLTALSKNALDAKEKFKVSFQVREARDKTLEGVEKFVFHIAKAGKITGAKWEISVPR